MSGERDKTGDRPSKKRQVLVTAAVGTAGVFAAVPFIASMMPSQRARPAGATDVSLTVIKRS